MVVADIASAATGTIRMAGQFTTNGLTAGLDYYVSATAGALTSTAPPNARYIGRADSSTSILVEANPIPTSVVNPLEICEGRLTLTSGTPVTTGDVSASVSAYWSPYRGNRIALYDGTQSWSIVTFTEITISLTGKTASTPYDVFAYNNSGTVAIELLAWTSKTARATALVLQDGVLVESGATTRRYLGSIYINSSGGQTDDTAAKRYVWNYYNRVPRALRVIESTASWTYNTATIRQARASTANQVEVVVGVAEVPVDLSLVVTMSNSNAATCDVQIGIGENSTTVFSTSSYGGYIGFQGGNSLRLGAVNRLTKFPAIGYSYYAWLEFSGANATTTFWGTGGGTVTSNNSGLSGWIAG